MDGGEPREQSGNSQKKNCVKITEHEDVKEITLPLKPKQLQELQNNDTYCRDIAKKLDKEVELQKIFIKESYILFIKWDLQEKQSNAGNSVVPALAVVVSMVSRASILCLFFR